MESIDLYWWYERFPALALGIFGVLSTLVLWIGVRWLRKARFDKAPPPWCAACGYSLWGLDVSRPSARCPECGADLIGTPPLRKPRRARWPTLLAILGWTGTVAAAAVFLRTLAVSCVLPMEKYQSEVYHLTGPHSGEWDSMTVISFKTHVVWPWQRGVGPERPDCVVLRLGRKGGGDRTERNLWIDCEDTPSPNSPYTRIEAVDEQLIARELASVGVDTTLEAVREESGALCRLLHGLRFGAMPVSPGACPFSIQRTGASCSMYATPPVKSWATWAVALVSTTAWGLGLWRLTRRKLTLKMRDSHLL